MTDDPIVEEVRRHRQEYAAEFNYDLKAMCDDLQRRTEEAAKAGHRVVYPATRRITPPAAEIPASSPSPAKNPPTARARKTPRRPD